MVHQLPGAVLQLLGSQGNQGMAGHPVDVGRHAHHLGHGPSGAVEDVGGDGGGGHPQPLHLYAVVHTARAAAPSIAYPHHQHVALLQDLVYDFALGGQGRVVLAEVEDLPQLVLTAQDLSDFL